tara:strand:- start:82 stop:744 length:663 start_codon:yes stop_codon:yes gene_type:complete
MNFKLVINTHIKYLVALNYLLESIKKTTISNNDYKNIIIIIGGCNQEKIEKKKYLNYEEMIFIYTKQNAFDFHGLNQLYTYKNHEYVKSNKYFYLLDSTSVESNFIESINNINIKPYEIVCHKIPFSSICLFSNLVIENYKTAFQGNLTKQQAINYEFSSNYNICKYGNVKYMGNRIRYGNKDIYNTGIIRQILYYPGFSCYKYIHSNSVNKFKDNEHIL